MRAFPPRLPEPPIFYPVTTEDYAIKIARDWNVRASGSGYVTRFEALKSYLDGYRIETAGARRSDVWGQSGSVSVELGVRRRLKHNKDIISKQRKKEHWN